jgi:hypothetical protein
MRPRTEGPLEGGFWRGTAAHDLRWGAGVDDRAQAILIWAVVVSVTSRASMSPWTGSLGCQSLGGDLWLGPNPNTRADVAQG